VRERAVPDSVAGDAVSEPNYDAEMELPEGKTCADCRHIKRCAAFGYSKPESTSCDFWPRRYAERTGDAVSAKADATTMGLVVPERSRGRRS